MARKPRVHYPSALYHVIIRGNARQDIFFDDEDRIRFCLLLQEGIQRYGHRIHAFCLMTNHVHLAVQVGDVSLSRIMQNLTFRYTKWINWRQNRSGHLFQGRYKAVLVDADSYLQELTRYIHLNPVRANMVKNPEEYSWSAHCTYLGREIIPWLTTDWVLSLFSPINSQARINYRNFVEQGKDAGYQQEYHSGSAHESRVLGDDSFIDRVLAHAESKPLKRITLEEILQKVFLKYGIEICDLKAAGKDRKHAEARGVVAWLILESGAGTLSELGRITGRDISTLSNAAKTVQSRAMFDEALACNMVELKQSLL